MTLDDGSAFECKTPEVELYGLRVSKHSDCVYGKRNKEDLEVLMKRQDIFTILAFDISTK